MFKIHKHTKTFYRYLVSYLVVFLIPVVTLGLFLYFQFFKTLKDEIVDNNVNSLIKLKNSVEFQTKELSNISYQIYLNNDLKPFKLEDNPYKSIITIDALSKLSAINPFIEDIFIYFNNDKYIYSSTGSYSIPMFIKNLYINWENFKEDMEYNNSSFIRTNELILNSNKKYITIVQPLESNYLETYGSLMFLIPEDSFVSLFSNSLNSNDTNTLIFDNDNNLLVSSKKENYINSPKLKEIIKNLKEDSTETVLDNKHYYMCCIKSDINNWKYVTLTPTEIAMQNLIKIKKLYLIALIVLSLINILIVNYLLKINYYPIKQLNYHVKDIESMYSSNNELENIKYKIDYLSEQNILLNSSIGTNKEALKESLLLSLLKGKINNIENFNKQGENININFTKDYFFVVTIYISSKNKNIINNRYSLIKDLETQLPNDCEGYGKEHIDNNKIIFIIGINDSSLNLEKLKPLQDTLLNKYNYNFNIIVGNVYKGINMIPKSYIETSYAFEYKFIKGINEIIMFQDIMKEQNLTKKYSYSQIKILKQLIRKKDIVQLEFVFDDMLNYIKNLNAPLFIIKGICFDVINIVNESLDDLEYNHKLNKKNTPNIFSLSDYQTIDEVINIIKGNCIQIIKEAKESDNNSSTLLDAMNTYIIKNYSNCAFSIIDMAEEFSMSSSSISQYYKEHTNKTISDYVTNLRMDAAKQLLIKSKHPLKTIAEEVGYYNVSSFIRRFKQMNNITPGEYRKQNKTS